MLKCVTVSPLKASNCRDLESPYPFFKGGNNISPLEGGRRIYKNYSLNTIRIGHELGLLHPVSHVDSKA